VDKIYGGIAWFPCDGMALTDFASLGFYRAMHFSAKRGIAIACRLAVCLSVCNVGEL